MLDFTICATTNLFRIYLIHRFVSVFFGSSEAGKAKRVLVCACFYLINTALFYSFHTAWVNILCNLAGIAAIVSLYTESLKANLFVTCSVYLVNCGCDVMTVSLFVNYQDGQVQPQVCSVMTVFLIFLCGLLAERILTVRKNREAVQNTPLLLVPLCSIAVIGALLYSHAYADVGLAIVGTGLLVVNFLMLYLYNLLLRSFSQKYELDALKTQVQAYANQLDVILQGEERIKALRHDLKHHLQELILLADKRHVPELQAYIRQMEAFIRNPKEFAATGNREIDSLLNYMLQRAREELDTVQAKILLPEEIRHSFDINVLLGNLLENAIDAARQTEKKYLSVHIALKKGVLKIKIDNSFSPSDIRQEKRGDRQIFLTTKSSEKSHGIGLKNVQQIVEKYNGAMETLLRDGLFCVSLILYLPEDENPG